MYGASAALCLSSTQATRYFRYVLLLAHNVLKLGGIKYISLNVQRPETILFLALGVKSILNLCWYESESELRLFYPHKLYTLTQFKHDY